MEKRKFHYFPGFETSKIYFTLVISIAMILSRKSQSGLQMIWCYLSFSGLFISSYPQKISKSVTYKRRDASYGHLPVKLMALQRLPVFGGRGYGKVDHFSFYRGITSHSKAHRPKLYSSVSLQTCVVHTHVTTKISLQNMANNQQTLFPSSIITTSLKGNVYPALDCVDIKRLIIFACFGTS